METSMRRTLRCLLATLAMSLGGCELMYDVDKLAPEEKTEEIGQGWSALGEPCQQDQHCVSGLECYPRLPDGYCSHACADDLDCEGGSRCLRVAEVDHNICLEACGESFRCRPKYRCSVMEGVCRPDAGDVVCPEGCVGTTGMCYAGEVRCDDSCCSTLPGT